MFLLPFVRDDETQNVITAHKNAVLLPVREYNFYGWGEGFFPDNRLNPIPAIHEQGAFITAVGLDYGPAATKWERHKGSSKEPSTQRECRRQTSTWQRPFRMFAWIFYLS